MNRMTKFIRVGEQNYRVKRVKKDLYAIYCCDGSFNDKFFGYQDKYGIEDAIYRGTW